MIPPRSNFFCYKITEGGKDFSGVHHRRIITDGALNELRFYPQKQAVGRFVMFLFLNLTYSVLAPDLAFGLYFITKSSIDSFSTVICDFR